MVKEVQSAGGLAVSGAVLLGLIAFGRHPVIGKERMDAELLLLSRSAAL